MDITDYLDPSELRARIFLCQARMHDIKMKRKRYHKNIRGAKILIKNIERCLDKKQTSELSNFEVSSVAVCLSVLRETLIELDHFWKTEVEYCVKLHQKMDELGERVYP